MIYSSSALGALGLGPPACLDMMIWSTCRGNFKRQTSMKKHDVSKQSQLVHKYIISRYSKIPGKYENITHRG